MNTLPDHLAHLATLTISDLFLAQDITDKFKVTTQRLTVGAHSGRLVTDVLVGDDDWRFFYNTEAQALIGHAAVVEALTEGRSPEYAVQS
jgi:hypothetical protein